MLAIHDRQSVSGFSRLEKLWVSPVGNRCGLQTKHRPKRDGLPPEIARDHRHQPISRKKFIGSAGAVLLGIEQKAIGVHHQSPISERGMNHWSELGSRFWLDARARRQKSDGVLHRRHTWHVHLRTQ